MLDNGAKLEYIDLNEDSPLHIACAAGNLEIVKLILEHKMKINLLHIPNKKGFHPLHLSCREGHEDVTHFLLTRGADPNTKDSTRTKNTPLHLALMYRHLNIAIDLCTFGASLTTLNNEENPPLFYAPQKMHALLEDAHKLGASPTPVAPDPRLSLVQFKDHSERLLRIVEDEKLSVYYREFLHRHYNNENLSFWLEAEDFKNLYENEETGMEERAMEIYQKYFKPGSNYELNISSKLRKDLKKQVFMQPTHLVFESVQNEIWELMAIDCVSKFLKSDLYKQFKNGTPLAPTSLHKGTLVYLEKFQKRKGDLNNNTNL